MTNYFRGSPKMTYQKVVGTPKSNCKANALFILVNTSKLYTASPTKPSILTHCATTHTPGSQPKIDPSAQLCDSPTSSDLSSP
jgi:hypothetical protein